MLAGKVVDDIKKSLVEAVGEANSPTAINKYNVSDIEDIKKYIVKVIDISLNHPV